MIQWEVRVLIARCAPPIEDQMVNKSGTHRSEVVAIDD